MGIIYGPVPSWRLGMSLGIDLLGGGEKRCSFNCIYCQLGQTRRLETMRGSFVDLGMLKMDMNAVEGKASYNVVTFSGTGEPTLSRDLADANRMVKRIGRAPTAVLTNSSLFPDENVREDLAGFDIVVAKLDAPSQELFGRINRPAKGVELENVLRGLKKFREAFRGTFALQMMFMEQNLHHAEKLGKLAREILPDEVHLNTPLRPCGVSPLDRPELCRLLRHFGDLNVLMVYDFIGKVPEVEPLDTAETLLRRPAEGRRRTTP